jgi:hypothetical protein
VLQIKCLPVLFMLNWPVPLVAFRVIVIDVFVVKVTPLTLSFPC